MAYKNTKKMTVGLYKLHVWHFPQSLVSFVAFTILIGSWRQITLRKSQHSSAHLKPELRSNQPRVKTPACETFLDQI